MHNFLWLQTGMGINWFGETHGNNASFCLVWSFHLLCDCFVSFIIKLKVCLEHHLNRSFRNLDFHLLKLGKYAYDNWICISLNSLNWIVVSLNVRLLWLLLYQKLGYSYGWCGFETKNMVHKKMEDLKLM